MSEGRRKYECAVNKMGQQGSFFVEEILEWFQKSRHQKMNGKEPNLVQNQGETYGNVYAKQEIMKLQALYYEERRKCQDLQSQLSRADRKNEEFEKLLGLSDQWKYGP